MTLSVNTTIGLFQQQNRLPYNYAMIIAYPGQIHSPDVAANVMQMQSEHPVCEQMITVCNQQLQIQTNLNPNTSDNFYGEFRKEIFVVPF